MKKQTLIAHQELKLGFRVLLQSELCVGNSLVCECVCVGGGGGGGIINEYPDVVHTYNDVRVSSKLPTTACLILSFKVS